MDFEGKHTIATNVIRNVNYVGIIIVRVVVACTLRHARPKHRLQDKPNDAEETRSAIERPEFGRKVVRVHRKWLVYPRRWVHWRIRQLFVGA